MAKTPATPKTFDDFYRDWDGWLDGAIEKVSRRNILRDSDLAQDLKQQVYLRLLTPDSKGQTHLEKFDETKGSFSHHIYRVVLHVMSNRFDKNTRTPTENAIPVIEASEGDEPIPGVLVLETFAGFADASAERNYEVMDFLDRLQLYLKETSQEWDEPLPMPDGTFRRKSLELVFSLMRQSLEPREIAAILRVTAGSVAGYVKKIKLAAAEFQQAQVKVA